VRSSIEPRTIPLRTGYDGPRTSFRAIAGVSAHEFWNFGRKEIGLNAALRRRRPKNPSAPRKPPMILGRLLPNCGRATQLAVWLAQCSAQFSEQSLGGSLVRPI
jgi:hypothetical protein